MLWTKVEKERLKRAYHARMSRAISGLEAMDISGLSQVCLRHEGGSRGPGS